MLGNTWLDYFEGNTRPDSTPSSTLALEVPEALRSPLVASLGRFQLGESAGGRIHEEIVTHRDPALDPGTRRSVQLYIEEEWRHARELAMVIRGLGGELQTAHWTNGAFTRCRRILGLRTKLLTLAVAEVAGIVYYRALAEGVGSPTLRETLTRIASEESQHLDFQAAFFAHAVELVARPFRGAYRMLLQVELFAIFTAALLVLFVDHGRLLWGVGARPVAMLRASLGELRSRGFLAPRPPRLKRLSFGPRGSKHARPSLPKQARPGDGRSARAPRFAARGN